MRREVTANQYSTWMGLSAPYKGIFYSVVGGHWWMAWYVACSGSYCGLKSIQKENNVGV